MTRDDSYPLPGKSCEFFSDSSVIITTCSDKKCKSESDHVHEVSSADCDGSSPGVPGFKNSAEARQALKKGVRDEIQKGTVRTFADAGKGPILENYMTKCSGQSCAIDGKSKLRSALLNAKPSSRGTRAAAAFHGKVDSVLYVASADGGEVETFRFDSTAGWQRVEIEETIEDCK